MISETARRYLEMARDKGIDRDFTRRGGVAKSIYRLQAIGLLRHVPGKDSSRDKWVITAEGEAALAAPVHA